MHEVVKEQICYWFCLGFWIKMGQTTFFLRLLVSMSFLLNQLYSTLSHSVDDISPTHSLDPTLTQYTQHVDINLRTLVIVENHEIQKTHSNFFQTLLGQSNYQHFLLGDSLILSQHSERNKIVHLLCRSISIDYSNAGFRNQSTSMLLSINQLDANFPPIVNRTILNLSARPQHYLRPHPFRLDQTPKARRF